MSDPAALRKDIADRKAKQDEVARKKKKNQLDTKVKALNKWKSAKTSPAEYFKASGSPPALVLIDNMNNNLKCKIAGS